MFVRINALISGIGGIVAYTFAGVPGLAGAFVGGSAIFLAIYFGIIALKGDQLREEGKTKP